MNPLLDPALMTAVLAAAERVINRALELAPGGRAELDNLTPTCNPGRERFG